jgi:ribosomal-protein-alanine N-acetyltransferase
MRDYDQWCNLRERSRVFLTPWEPIWPADDLTRASFRRRLRAHAEEIENDEAYPLLIFRDDETLVGGLTVGQIRRGVSQTGTLGYWMGEGFAGRGYMSRAVRAAAHFTFGSLRLHRLEAACLQHNAASMRVLERVGFRREGFARSYLRINGRWQDHVLYALIETDVITLPSKPLT